MTGEWTYNSNSAESDGKKRNENEGKAEKPQYIQFANKITNHNGDIHGDVTIHMD